VNISHFAAGTLAVFMLAACGPTTEPAPTPTEPEVTTADCPVTVSRNWAATVNRMPSTDGSTPNISVTGQVDFSSLGWTWTLTRNAADTPDAPTVRLTFAATAPTGSGGSAITPTDVNYRGAVGAGPVTEVQVLCGRGVLATITEISEVH
jgi:hypothetical protein